MPVNYKLFEEVKQAILDEPTAVNMSMGIAAIADGHQCGTVGCIAGHTCMLGLRDSENVIEAVSRRFGISISSRLRPQDQCSWPGVMNQARELLGIDQRTASYLFYFYDKVELMANNVELADRLMPLSVKLSNCHAGSREYAEVVAEAIDVTVAYLKEQDGIVEAQETKKRVAAEAPVARRKKQIHVHITE